MSCSQFQQYTEAGLKCAAAYNHCASSCQKKEEIQIMTRPAQADTGTAFRHDAAAQLMKPGSKEGRRSARKALPGMLMIIAACMRKPAVNVVKNVAK